MPSCDDAISLNEGSTRLQDEASVSKTPVEQNEQHQPGVPIVEYGKAQEQSETIGKEEPVLQDQTNILPTKQVVIAFLALGSALFLAILDQTLVATTLPTITKHFGGGSDATWVATAYLLTSTAFQPLFDRLSDTFGRKPVLLLCVGIFTTFSLACGLAQTLVQLIIFRALAGVGCSGISTLALCIVGDIVSLRKRGQYQGYLSAMIAIAQGVGPVIGAIFSQYASWRWSFLINVPIGIVVILVSLFFLPLKRVTGDIKTKLRQIDYGGCALVLSGTILILVALSYGGQALPWNAALVLSTLILGLALWFGLFFYEWKVAKLPIIPLRTFKNRTVAGFYALNFSLGAANFLPLFYVPSFFQIVRGFTAIQAGLMLLPLLITQVALNWLSGLLVQKTGRCRPSIICGFFLWSIGSGLLSSVDERTPTANVIGYLLICGFGAGQTFQTSLVLAQAASSKADMASVTSMRNFVRALSGTVMLAIGSNIINNSLRREIQRQSLPPEAADAFAADPLRISSSDNTYNLTAEQRSALASALTQGIQISYYIVTALLVLAFFISVLVLQHHELSRASDKQDKADGKQWWADRKAKKQKTVEKDVEGDEKV